MAEREDGRSDETSSPSGGAEIRLVWRDGPFRLECVGRQGEMRLTVFEASVVRAQADVISAEAAYQRGGELCAGLIRDRPRGYGKDSA